MIRDRSTLGAEIKRLRKEKGITGKELADHLEVSQAFISQVESGKRKPTQELVDGLKSVLALKKAEAANLESMAADFFISFDRWGVDKNTYKTLQESVLQQEKLSEHIRICSIHFLHGLVQTPNYARYIFRSAVPETPEKQITATVRKRMQRKSVLNDNSKRIQIVMSEAVLANWFMPEEVMEEQLEDLLSRNATNLELRVLPLNKSVSVFAVEPFIVYDSRRVDIETLTMNMTLWEHREISMYENLFGRLMSESLNEAQSREIIQQYLDKLKE